MSTAAREQLDELLDELPSGNLQALLDVLRGLGGSSRLRRWSNVIGSMSDAEAEELRRAIEEGCERVDREDW